MRPFAQDFSGSGTTGALGLYGGYPTPGSGAANNYLGGGGVASGSLDARTGAAGGAVGGGSQTVDAGSYSSAYPVGDFPSGGDFSGVA